MTAPTFDYVDRGEYVATVDGYTFRLCRTTDPVGGDGWQTPDVSDGRHPCFARTRADVVTIARRHLGTVAA